MHDIKTFLQDEYSVKTAYSSCEDVEGKYLFTHITFTSPENVTCPQLCIATHGHYQSSQLCTSHVNELNNDTQLTLINTGDKFVHTSAIVMPQAHFLLNQANKCCKLKI